MSSEFHGLFAKSVGDPPKDLSFARLHGSRNMLLNTNQGNQYFVFVITMLKYVHIGWKFQGTSTSSISFF